jgi:hypothetical protein
VPQPLEQRLRLVEASQHHIGVDQPEAARQNAPPGGSRRPNATVVALHKPPTIRRRSIASIVPVCGSSGAEADHGEQQQARIELLLS